MVSILLQYLTSLATGLVVGLVFAFFKLPIPAPPAVSAVFGILGITLGYLLYQRWTG